MKRILLLLMLILSQVAFGQDAGRPKWAEDIPETSTHSTYYYRVGEATGRTQEEAIQNAYRQVLLESADAMGITFTAGTLADSTFRTASKTGYRVYVNKVCQEAFKSNISPNYRGFVLCQVGHSATEKPRYRPFNCKTGQER